jgi:hypothetical protein
MRIFGPDHIILAVVEADDIEAVRNFIVQSRLMQWNTVNTYATYKTSRPSSLRWPLRAAVAMRERQK